MSSRPNEKKPCSAARKPSKRPYASRPRSGLGRVRPDANAVRVVLPDGPPRLNPEAARTLLRILLKAHDQLNGPDTPQEAA
jgi:hypothetical protein